MSVRRLQFKPHSLHGISELLLISHYENNHGAARRRLNAIHALGTPDPLSVAVFGINGRKREELVAAGSVVRHEIYFDALAGDGGNPPAGLGLAEALERDSGSLAAWRAEFTALAEAEAGGSGWASLTCSKRFGRLVNQWAADHAHGLVAGAPILALDLYEHSCQMDFGAKAAAYFDVVMGNLHWERIATRYRCACHGEAEDPALFAPFGGPSAAGMVISAEDLLHVMEDDSPALVDVCLRDNFNRRADMIPGATLHNPEALGRWAPALPGDKPIVVYCHLGFQVSGGVVTELRRRGYDARTLKGGIGAWHAIGGPTVRSDHSTYEE